MRFTLEWQLTSAPHIVSGAKWQQVWSFATRAIGICEESHRPAQKPTRRLGKQPNRKFSSS
jgi:hypothetical protein